MGMIFCILYILDIDNSLNSIFIEQHESTARTYNDGVEFSVKGKSLHPTVLISYLPSYIEYKRVALKKR